MSHLTPETLARLIEEAPEPTEAEHLDRCTDCRAELEAMRADVAALNMLPDPEPSPAQWLRLEQRLEREGLLRRHARWQPMALRMAAAFVMFALGGASTALVLQPMSSQQLAGNNPVPTVQQPQQQVPVVATPVTTITDSNSTQEPVLVATRPTPATAEVLPPRTPQEAAALLRTAESAYLAALSRYAELSGGGEEIDPLARLAALESIVATTRAALGNAPADPVINGYHLTAVAQRDALLRQVSASGQTWY